MKKICQACGIEKDMKVLEIFKYDDGMCQDEPIDPLVQLPCQPHNYDDPFRVVTVCHECFHKLSPDMWIGQGCWEELNPIVKFNDLPLERHMIKIKNKDKIEDCGLCIGCFSKDITQPLKDCEIYGYNAVSFNCRPFAEGNYCVKHAKEAILRVKNHVDEMYKQIMDLQDICARCSQKIKKSYIAKNPVSTIEDAQYFGVEVGQSVCDKCIRYKIDMVGTYSGNIIDKDQI